MPRYNRARPALAQRSQSTEPVVSPTDGAADGGKRDPRNGCCHGGDRFVHGLKAMITRMIFLAHSMVTVWRVTIRLPDLMWWLLSIPFGALIVESLYVMLAKHGKEWKWYSPILKQLLY